MEAQVSAVIIPEPSEIPGPEKGGGALEVSQPADPSIEEANPKASSQGEDIRTMQARLKTAGFNPGPVDGILGVKTKAALARLESACEKLSDLLVNAAVDRVDKSRAGSRVTSAGVLNDSSMREAVRLLQVRLKEAGFDPGALDGIAGTRTKAALARLESACAPRR
jgi:peptidoglycan hydrolase-like protein with peptidoglycan-binding domain